MPPPQLSRRFMYPEKSISCENYMVKKQASDVFDALDKPDKVVLEPRTSYLKVGALATVKGSAYMEYGNTKLMASVEPPREMTKATRKTGILGEVICTLKYAPFATRDITSLARQESSMSMALKKALDPVICRHEFPSFELEIKVIVLDDDGCVLSTAINCCGAALVDSGIPTYGIVTASTVCFYKEVEFVNPTATVEALINNISAKDANGEHGIVVTSTLDSLKQISMCFQKGFFSPETLKLLSDHSLEINKSLLNSVCYTLVNKVKEHIKK